MRLELLAGPLEESRVLAVSALYGVFNPKYRDPAFCRRLFNENPHGAGVHAFVLDDNGEAAGHYGIVPLAIRVRGERRLSGKGEAYVVRADQREAAVQVGDDPPLSIGMAMPLHLYPFAVEHGLDPVHMLAPADVAPLHRMSGCRSLAVRPRRVGIVLRPAALRPEPAGRIPPALVRVLGAGLAAASVLRARAELSLAGAAGRWAAMAATREQLARVVADLPLVTGWGLDVDLPSLEWQSKFSELEWLELGGGAGYALVCARAGEGRAMEVVQLRPRDRGAAVLRRLLAAVILHAWRRGSVLLALSDHAVADGGVRADLLAAARSLGLRDRRHQPGMLVYTRDRWYLDPANLTFTPFFHASF
jgi:hypothetical protein